MDEEIAVHTLGIEELGIDASDIPQFDNWLISDKNYENLIPEKKGIRRRT